MNSALSLRWNAFVTARESARDTALFVGVFYAIWMVYDALDLAFGGTAATFWLSVGGVPVLLTALQAMLVVAQVLIVFLIARGGVGRTPVRILIGAALAARTIEAFVFFPLNDFFYYCVTTFIILNVAIAEDGTVTAWPRRVLLYQTAWTYFATALLKCNPHWLSGEHLWVRLGYFQSTFGVALPWSTLLTNVAVDRVLAIVGSVMEFSMVLVLLTRAPRALAVALAIAIHGFAALTVNVYFFGLAMIAQVWFVSYRRSYE